jgi:hypothetical protein
LSQTPKAIGLDGMKTYEYEDGGAGTTKFGDATTQFDDARTLGAAMLRQHGLRDLLWGMLSAGHVPLAADLPRAVKEASLTTESNVDRFAGLFQNLWDRGQNVPLPR